MSTTSNTASGGRRRGGNATTSHTFEATFTCVNGKTMGRIIGTGGSGTKRITNTTRSRFHGSAPYLRGDRNTNTIALTARGEHGAEAVRFMAQMILDEQNWATGKSTVCPHPHRYVPVGDSKNVRHVIGQRGNGLREVQNQAGKGVFIVHKPDRNAYLIEAMTERDVALAVNYLNMRIQKIIFEQTPRVTNVDIRAVGEDASSGGGTTLSSSGSSDDEGDDDHDHDHDAASVASQIRAHIGSMNSNSSRDQNQHHQMARMAVADATGCHPSFVKDHQIQAYIRAQAALAQTALGDMEHAKAVAQRESDSESLASSDLGQFPTLSSSTKPAQVTLEVTEIEPPPKQFDIKLEEGHFASALLPVTATSSAAPPPPPAPTGISRQFSSAAPPMPTGMSRQFSTAAPPPPPMPTGMSRQFSSAVSSAPHTNKHAVAAGIPALSRSLTTREDTLNEGLGEMPGSVSQFTSDKSTTPTKPRNWGDMMSSDDDDDDHDDHPIASHDSRFNPTNDDDDYTDDDMPPLGSC